MSFQILKFDTCQRKWVQAWGLKSRSFIRADNQEQAIEEFYLRTKRCRQHLVLVNYAYSLGYHTKPLILAQINDSTDRDKVLLELFQGQHLRLRASLSRLLADNWPDIENSNEIACKLNRHFFFDQLQALLDYPLREAS